MSASYSTRAANEYGREDGLAEGCAEGLKESARLLMESGMSKEEVARRLKMDVSELED